MVKFSFIIVTQRISETKTSEHTSPEAAVLQVTVRYSFQFKCKPLGSSRSLIIQEA